MHIKNCEFLKKIIFIVFLNNNGFQMDFSCFKFQKLMIITDCEVDII